MNPILETVQKITTPISLCAFIVALVYFFLRFRVKTTLDTISKAPKENLNAVLSAASGQYNIDTANLTREQRLGYIEQVLRAKERLQTKILVFSGFIALLLFALIIILSLFNQKSVEAKTVINHSDSVVSAHPNDTLARSDKPIIQTGATSNHKPEDNRTRSDIASRESSESTNNGHTFITVYFNSKFEDGRIFIDGSEAFPAGDLFSSCTLETPLGMHTYKLVSHIGDSCIERRNVRSKDYKIIFGCD